MCNILDMEMGRLDMIHGALSLPDYKERYQLKYRSSTQS